MSVSDDEVISHYEANKNSFVTEDAVALEYVLLSADNFQEQVVITDEDIRAAYDEGSSATSDVERRARHILISSADDALDKGQWIETAARWWSCIC